MSQGRLEVDDLRLLQAIGEGGSLSAAARNLDLDHSNAFRRLGAMETRLGVRLFERSRDGYAPTPAGEAAIASAARILSEIDRLVHRLAGEDLRPSGTVRITTTDTLAALLVPLLRDFRAAHPEIVTELIVSNAFMTLTRRDADVALRPSPDPGDALVGRRVGEIAFAVYGTETNAKLVQSDHASLQTLDWVGFDDSIGHIGAAQWVATHIPTARVVHRSNSIVAMQEAARAGLGLALLPRYMGDAVPELIRLGDDISDALTPLWILTHRDMRRVARIRALLDFLHDAMARPRTMQKRNEPPAPKKRLRKER